MKHPVFHKSTRHVLAVLITIVAAVFAIAHFRASASLRPHVREISQITTHAQNPDSPWIKLQNSRAVNATYRNVTAQAKSNSAEVNSVTRSLDSARALSLASNDFNIDGFPDLVCGYAIGNGGLVSIQRGNPASYAPEDPEILRGIGQQEFPDPFFQDAGYVELPEPPDFLGTVDFDRDGQADIVTAARGSDAIYLIAGDGHGGFLAPQRIALPGAVTTMITGKIDQADGTTSLILGLNVPGGSAVAIYEGTKSLLDSAPVVHAVPAEVTAIAPGHLDADQFDDLAILAGGRGFVLHGRGQSQVDNALADKMAGKIEPIDLPFTAQAIAIGTFVWSRDGAQQIALLDDSGTVHVAARGQLDTRPFTADEVFAKRQALEETRAEMELASREGKTFMAPESELPAPKSWGVVEDLAPPVAKSFAATATGNDLSQSIPASPILLSTRISTLPSDDLLIMNPAAGEFQISYNQSSRSGAAQANLASPQRSAVDLDASSQPVAVLPMRVSVDGRPGLIVLTQDSAAPKVMFPEAALTYHVTGVNADATTPCAGVTCTTLRAAIIAANANAGADTIVFDVNGTFTLSLTGSDNASAVGDLDINDSVTITGNGSANTIISTNYTNTCGDCKVFGVNQDGTHNNLTVSFSGVTIQNGFNAFNTSCGSTFQETGGGVDFFLTGTTVNGNIYSMTNCVITNNKATGTACSSRHGGGVNVDSAGQATAGGVNIGTVSFTGCTFSTNSADQQGGGLTLAADKHDVTMTNCTIGGAVAANGNQSTVIGVGGGIWTRHSFGGTVTINGGSFQNNKATSTVLNGNGAGGGIEIDGNQVTNIGVTTGVSFSDNSALETGGGSSIAGGIGITNLGAAGVTGSTQISNSTISHNHADNGTAAQGGGIYFNGHYSAIVSNCTIGGAAAANGNSSSRGAGIFNGGGNGTTSLTVDTGTIVSNNAATGPGGGVANVDSTGAITILNGLTIDSNTAGSGGSGIDMTLDSGGSGSSMTLQGTMNLNGGNGLYIGRGTLTSTSGTLNLSGDFKRDSTGTFTHNGGTLNFNGGGAQNINGTATSESFNNFIVNKGGGTLTVGGSTTSLTLSGNVTLTAGGFSAGTATGITLNTGSWTNNGGTFTPSSSVVSFTNTVGGQNINGTATTQTFNGITVAKSAQTLAVGGSTTTLTLNGSMTLTSGTFDKGTAAAINVGGDWTNNGGTFTSGTGTVTFNGGGAQNLNGSAATQTFNNFAVNKGGGTLTGGGSTTTLTLNGGMTLTSGTFAAGTITNIGLPGDWTNNGGAFTPGSSTVTFNSTTAGQNINGSAASQTFNGITVNKTGQTLIVGGSTATLTLNGTMTLTAGSFDKGTATNINVGGNWTNNGGSFASGTGTVTFNSAAAQAINGTAAIQTFNNITVNKSATTLSVGGSTTSLAIVGNLLLTAGTFDKGTAATINIQGNWTNNSSGTAFTAGTGTVNFAGGAGQTISGSASTTFNNLTNSDAGGITMNNNNALTGILALTSSDISVASGMTLTQLNTGSSSGTFDVNGNLQRTGIDTAALGTTFSFGNPNNQITVTAGTRPATITVNLVRSVPTGAQGFPTAVQRTYTITPSAGGFTGTLRLHYLDSELNGNTEGAGLALWRFNGTGWSPQPNTSFDTTANWVEKTGVTTFSPWTMNSTNSPTASSGMISGRITDASGVAVSGAVINLNGDQTRKTITDANGNYKFDNVEANGFYTVTPSRANFSFSPAQRSFSLVGDHTEAAFTGTSIGDNANPLDTPEFFVRQQYVDILGREPDEGGFNYWSNQILACNGNPDCIRSERASVAAAFFVENEFKQTGSFIYDVYSGALGRRPGFTEYSSDRQQVIAGPNLDAEKAAFALSFAQRPEFTQKYQSATTAESYVDALLQTVQQASGVDLSSQRDALIADYHNGTDLNQGRALVLSDIAANASFNQAQYNKAFVLVEYFGYLQRNPDQGGYDFWLNVISNREVGNYRGMVCAFITSTEYQQRFSSVITHSNAECGN